MYLIDRLSRIVTLLDDWYDFCECYDEGLYERTGNLLMEDWGRKLLGGKDNA